MKRKRNKEKMSRQNKFWFKLRNVIRIVNKSNCTADVEVIKPSEHIPSTKTFFGYYVKGSSVDEIRIMRSRSPLYQGHATEFNNHKRLTVNVYVGWIKTYTADLDSGDEFEIQSQHLKSFFDGNNCLFYGVITIGVFLVFILFLLVSKLMCWLYKSVDIKHITDKYFRPITPILRAHMGKSLYK